MLVTLRRRLNFRRSRNLKERKMKRSLNRKAKVVQEEDLEDQVGLVDKEDLGVVDQEDPVVVQAVGQDPEVVEDQVALLAPEVKAAKLAKDQDLKERLKQELPRMLNQLTPIKRTNLKALLKVVISRVLIGSNEIKN